MTLARNSYRYLRRALRIVQGGDIWCRVQIKEKSSILGSSRASWRVCTERLSSNSVVYSMGVGEEVSFELELIRKVGMKVYAFDPTPRAIEWVGCQSLPEHFVFHPYGVADYDGVCDFRPPDNPLYVSHTMLPRKCTKPPIRVPVCRLVTIMKTLGHSRVHMLKMDIEGAEYNVLDDVIRSGIRIDQLLVEFHHRWPEVGIDKTRRMIQNLNLAGYKVFSVSASGEEYGFLYSD